MTPVSSRRAEFEQAWTPTYWAGAAAAALSVLVTVLHSGVFFVVGLPASVGEWFSLFAANPLGGVLAFEGLMVVYVLLYVPIVVALYVSLRRHSPSLMALYAGVAIIGIAAFVAARPAFEMLTLSSGYASATTDAQRSTYLAAGEATLAVFNGTAFWVSYFAGSIGGLLLAVVMLRTPVFSKATAYLRLASSVLDFGILIPTIGLPIALGSVVCLAAFNVLIARRFLSLARDASATVADGTPVLAPLSLPQTR